MPKSYVIAIVIVALILVGAGIRMATRGQQSITPATTELADTATDTPTDSPTEASTTSPAATPAATTETVTFSQTGFSPKSLTVKQGTTVTFKNTSSASVWPASNPHPSHTTYPAFDAETGIEPGGSYQFTFDRVGAWNYHNHLNSSQSGTIVVQ